MKHIILLSIVAISLFVTPKKSYAWGRQGHSLVAEIAFHYMDITTQKKVMKFLNGMTIEDAASWMDNIKSDHAYDYLKPDHYINIEKGDVYTANNKDNIVNELNKVISELNKSETLTDANIQTDLLILMHLMGDLHQPLHDGYGSDKGGNTSQVSFMNKGTNIHAVWDSEIINYNNVELNDCLQFNHYTPQELIELDQLNIVGWMGEGRLLLDKVYDFKGNKIDETYINAEVNTIEKQLLKAGLRLASILENLFKHINREPVFATENKEILSVGLNVLEQYEGKLVKVCTKIYGTKFLDNNGGKPTFLNAGAAFPNSPLTILIWGDNRKNFKNAPEKYYDGKDVCITGKIVMYKGKPEIIVTKEDEIEVK